MNVKEEMLVIIDKIVARSMTMKENTKLDVKEINSFFDKWSPAISYAAKKDSKLRRDTFSYNTCSSPSENQNFNYLKFMSENKRFIEELEKLLNKVRENSFNAFIEDPLLYIIISDDSIPNDIKNLIDFYDDKGKKVENPKEEIDKQVGKIYSFNIKNTPYDNCVINEIKKLISSGDNCLFNKRFMNFIINSSDLYIMNKLNKEDIDVINNIIDYVIISIQNYGFLFDTGFNEYIKPCIKKLEKIRSKIKSNKIIGNQLVKMFEEDNPVFYFLLQFGDDFEKLNTLIKNYNKKFNEVNNTSEDITSNYEYLDEEISIVNVEKQMLEDYLKEKVFNKFTSINNAYNPKVLIDAEDLYANMPCANKKEGLELIMKKLKSQNVNHEINSLIIKLNLINKGKSKVKK